jgi:hypothetical protein
VLPNPIPSIHPPFFSYTASPKQTENVRYLSSLSSVISLRFIFELHLLQPSPESSIVVIIIVVNHHRHHQHH